jgi:hypothetical protein
MPGVNKSGGVTPYRQVINAQGQAATFSVSEATDRHLNRNQKQVWSLPFTGIDPVGANDYFFHIKNTGTTDLAITDIRIESSVIGTVEVHGVMGIASYAAGVDITPVTRNIGAGENPTATIKTDTNTTGLTSSGVIFYINCSTANEIFHLRTTSNIIIPPGQQVALLWDTATGILKGAVSLVQLVSNQ